MFASRRPIHAAAAAAFAVALVSEPAAASPSHRLKLPTTSTNWAGYAAKGGRFTTVTATFTQPALDCSKGDGYSSFWVGLDGYNTRSVEQTGIEADCTGGVASYSAWYEMYPTYPVTYHNTVRPGDVITESVTYRGKGAFALTLTDHTAGWSRTSTAKAPGARRASAEVVVEAPDLGGATLPLADFGTVAYRACSVDGSTLDGAKPVGMNLASASGGPEANVSTLARGSFAVAWRGR